MAKSFAVEPEKKVYVDEFVGMLETESNDCTEAFDAALHKLLAKYRDPAAIAETLKKVTDFWDKYPKYLVPDIGDEKFRPCFKNG